MVASAKYTTNELLHYLRNPWGLNADEVRYVRHEAANELEHLMKMLREANEKLRASQETFPVPDVEQSQPATRTATVCHCGDLNCEDHPR